MQESIQDFRDEQRNYFVYNSKFYDQQRNLKFKEMMDQKLSTLKENLIKMKNKENTEKILKKLENFHTFDNYYFGKGEEKDVLMNFENMIKQECSE